LSTYYERISAAACDLYDDTDLDAARHMTRDGHTLDHAPTLFTESPTLLRWPIERTVQIKPGAAPLPGLSIHRHGPLEHFYYRDADWHGMVLAAGPVEAVLDAGLLSMVYATPLTVRRIDGDLVVLPGRRT
jgi:hypothetical protein